MMKLKTNKNYIKGSRKNFRNQNNKDQIEKKIYITNQDWRMNLKTNKNYTKISRKNIRNKKNKD
jgi:hypothetical protein